MIILCPSKDHWIYWVTTLMSPLETGDPHYQSRLLPSREGPNRSPPVSQDETKAHEEPVPTMDSLSTAIFKFGSSPDVTTGYRAFDKNLDKAGSREKRGQ
ncbi:hypothetical protein Y1Q_0019063 [Alligator mississippiensis]|uniref:Uncharacterized protein n=1 Tax=Alligator mississippiensis TaxID=8496 RepID=A0A151N134_ALLMI|nr:hypothetical protein Y1Q_0019063 [Alligator mississippiensis]